MTDPRTLHKVLVTERNALFEPGDGAAWVNDKKTRKAILAHAMVAIKELRAARRYCLSRNHHGLGQFITITMDYVHELGELVE